VQVRRLLRRWKSGASLWTEKAEPGIRVLSYHKVNDILSENLTVARAAFAKQMRHLSEAEACLSLDSAIERLISGREATGVVVTFDDGFADNHQNALPVLVNHGITAAFFLATDYVGTDKVFSRDRQTARANRFINWEQAGELVDAGMTVGAHTASHVRPNAVPLEVFRSEAERSKKTIEDKLGRSCEFFAYPWGRARDFDRRHVDVIQQLGFRAALATINGVNRFGQDLFQLRRTTVYGSDDMTVFRGLLAGRLDGFSFKNVRMPQTRRCSRR